MQPNSISYFKAIHGTRDLQSSKEAKVMDYQRRFAREFDSSINVVYDATRNDKQQDFIIVPAESGCKLWARPGETFNIGDIIFFNGLHWLITDVDFADELNRSGEMVRCNRQLRWQNPKTGKIVERWALITKPYTSNLDTDTEVTTSDREFKVQLPFDEETRNLDLGKRFMLEIINGKPRTYRCSSVDQSTNKYQDVDGGFIVLNIIQDEERHERDNVDLMICDYLDVTETRLENEHLIVDCKVSGRNNIRVNNEPRRYKASFFDPDGNAIDGVIPVWTVTCSGAEELLDVTYDGLDVLVGTSSVDLVDEVVTISAMDSKGICDAGFCYAKVVSEF